MPVSIRYPDRVGRLRLVILTIALASCAPAPPPPQKAAPDLTAEAWYAEATRQLAAVDREGNDLFNAGRFEEVSVAIAKGQPLQERLLEATHPTLPAMEAAADLDDLYARMLVHNGRHGWARTIFQKNVVRWKTWKPQTPETERRWKAAVDAVAECDRRL
jgi:hypothetical protein